MATLRKLIQNQFTANELLNKIFIFVIASFGQYGTSIADTQTFARQACANMGVHCLPFGRNETLVIGRSCFLRL